MKTNTKKQLKDLSLVPSLPVGQLKSVGASAPALLKRGSEMTDYLEARSVRCKKCGVLTCDVDPACDCQYTDEESNENTCPECGITLDAELFPTLRACYDHEEDRETLREIAAGLDEIINIHKKFIKAQAARITELEALFLKRF